MGDMERSEAKLLIFCQQIGHTLVIDLGKRLVERNIIVLSARNGTAHDGVGVIELRAVVEAKVKDNTLADHVQHLGGLAVTGILFLECGPKIRIYIYFIV